MSTASVPLADALRDLASSVEELEDVECEECAKHADMPTVEWWWQDAYERLVDKLADYKRGIATLDEVYDEADV